MFIPPTYSVSLCKTFCNRLKEVVYDCIPVKTVPSKVNYCPKMMDLKVCIQLVLMCAVNVVFTCTGIFLNLLVIVSFWRSSEYLRNKLYYFMIMVLSFFDFLLVITNHPFLVIRVVLWLKEKNDVAKVPIYENFSIAFVGFSVTTLLVMSIERYLGAYYPFFHRTSLTRRRLLTLLAILIPAPTILLIISADDLVISSAAVGIMFFFTTVTPFVFFNYKLFIISRKARRDIARRRDNTSSPEISTLHVNLKHISTCLLSVGCFLLTYFPAIFFFAFNFAETPTSENTTMARFWISTAGNVNSTMNCLIFFWKSDVLRREGKKTVKALKDFFKFAS